MSIQAEAIQSYIAQEDDELSLNIKDVIHVTLQEKDGWWFGKLASGKEGWFPSNFVRVSSLPRQPLTDQGSIRARVLYSYQATDDDEMDLHEGDIIFIVKQEPNWWVGEKDGKIGMFPANFVQLITSESKKSRSSSTVCEDDQLSSVPGHSTDVRIEERKLPPLPVAVSSSDSSEMLPPPVHPPPKVYGGLGFSADLLAEMKRNLTEKQASKGPPPKPPRSTAKAVLSSSSIETIDSDSQPVARNIPHENESVQTLATHENLGDQNMTVETSTKETPSKDTNMTTPATEIERPQKPSRQVPVAKSSPLVLHRTEYEFPLSQKQTDSTVELFPKPSMVRQKQATSSSQNGSFVKESETVTTIHRKSATILPESTNGNMQVSSSVRSSLDQPMEILSSSTVHVNEESNIVKEEQQSLTTHTIVESSLQNSSKEVVVELEESQPFKELSHVTKGRPLPARTQQGRKTEEEMRTVALTALEEKLNQNMALEIKRIEDLFQEKMKEELSFREAMEKRLVALEERLQKEVMQ